jgi:protein-disulfide isomerase
MSSRTAQKERARSWRLEQERALAHRARRRRRLQLIAGAVVSAVVVVALAVAISSSGSSAKGLATGESAKRTVASVDRELAGIPQSGTRLGSSSAPVKIYYYGDLECPVCRAFTTSSFSQLVSHDVRAGRVQVIYRALETATSDPTTFQTQQVAALAAGEQNRFWYYAELFYRQQGAEGSGYVTESYLDGLSRQVPGLDHQRWLSDRGSSSLAAQVRTDARQAAAVGANATPTLVFQGARGKVATLSGIPSYGQLEQAVMAVA